MRARKPKKPSRAIQYMLSADRTLRKLSLKKVKESGTKPRRIRKPNTARAASPARGRSERRPAKPAGDARPSDRAQSTNSWAFAFTVVGAVAIATMLTARPGSMPRDGNTTDTRRQPPPTAAATTHHLDAGKSLTDVPAPTAAENRATNSPRRVADSPASVPTKPAAPVLKTAATPTSAPSVPQAQFASTSAVSTNTSDREPAKPATAPANVTAATADESSVTLTGCVENSSGTFRLKDTAGADAPKERGWRTGFLRKRPARIDLVDPANTFRLAGYVGQRVAATGVLSDRELRPRSVRRVAGSCQ